MAQNFLFDGDVQATITVLLAHGAGAPMDSARMTEIATALALAGFRVARFEFNYMAARREGARKVPPKAETLIPEYRLAVEELAVKGPLVIGGKSMGGRVASMVADSLYSEGAVAGLLCLGYPFHPLRRPDRPRTAHLVDLRTPAMIIQGTRDEFGTLPEVAALHLSSQIEMLWLADGDHDLKPRKTVSGFTTRDHLKTLSTTAYAWAERITTSNRGPDV